MDLKDFETLYVAACEIQKSAGTNPVVAESLRKQRRVLLKNFAKLFPESLKMGCIDPSFDVVRFMDMLIKYPELARLNSQKFVSLMEDLIEQGIEISPLLKEMLEVMREKPQELSEEEKNILCLLGKNFPDCWEKLSAMDYDNLRILNFMVKHPDVLDGKRHEFICLMVDMTDKKQPIPTELKNQWRSFVMHP